MVEADMMKNDAHQKVHRDSIRSPRGSRFHDGKIWSHFAARAWKTMTSLYYSVLFAVTIVAILISVAAVMLLVIYVVIFLVAFIPSILKIGLG